MSLLGVACRSIWAKAGTGDNYIRYYYFPMSTLVNSIVMILFGLSTNFYLGISLRLLWGVMDGYLGICKTILSEVCSPDMLPITTGLIFVSMALASTAGPILGGYLSDPEELLAPLIERIPYLSKVPFAIPLCLCGLGCFLCTAEEL